MNIRYVKAAAFVAAGVGIAACDSPAVTECSEYFDAYQATLERCDLTSLSGLGDPTAKDRFIDSCGAFARAPGGETFAATIAACARALPSATCDTAASLDCGTRGTLPDHAACATDAQCKGGICAPHAPEAHPTSEVVCGTCTSYLQLGNACLVEQDKCDPSKGFCSAATHECVPYSVTGEPCGKDNTLCAAGFNCNFGAFRCEPLPAQGEACEIACQQPLRCVSDHCADGAKVGDACPNGFECAGDLECGPTKFCVAPKKAGLGESCGFADGKTIACIPGLSCTNAAGAPKCLKLKEAGEACAVDAGDCASYLRCIDGTCAVPDFSVCQ